MRANAAGRVSSRAHHIKLCRPMVPCRVSLPALLVKQLRQKPGKHATTLLLLLVKQS